MTDHCCEMMRSNVENICPDHPDRFDCPDALIHYGAHSHRYGIIVHDGGSSMKGIVFCPWCGTKLPEPIEADIKDEDETA